MINRRFVYSIDSAESNISPSTDDLNKGKTPIKVAEKKKELSFIGKIKKALQEWSNSDKKDEDFDNTQV